MKISTFGFGVFVKKILCYNYIRNRVENLFVVEVYFFVRLFKFSFCKVIKNANVDLFKNVQTNDYVE